MMAKKRISVLILLLIVAVSTCAVAFSACNPSGTPTTEVHEMQTTIIDSSELSLTAVATAASDSSSVTITATIAPASATDQSIDWSLSWVNPNGTFASGKNVTDYVGLVADGNTATVTCKQAFGDQIAVTASATAYPEVSANCLLDYARRLNGSSYYVYEYTEGSSSIPSKPGSASITAEEDVYYVNCSLPSDATTALESVVYYRIEPHTYSYGIGTTNDNFDVSISYSLNSGLVNEIRNYCVSNMGYTADQVLIREDSFNNSIFNFVMFAGSSATNYGIYVAYMYDKFVSDIVSIVNKYNSQNIWTVTINYTGAYSSFTDTVGIRFNNITVPATAMSVSPDSVCF